VIKEFKAFIMRGNVVDLAVGFIMGAAFKSLVDSFVANVINPILGIFGNRDFSRYLITLKHSADPDKVVELRWGAFLTDVISFVLIAVAVFFFVVKPINALNERRKRGDVDLEDQPAPSDEALLLAEIRDLLRAGQSA
jgi:large conductance mechanosensitive channel